MGEMQHDLSSRASSSRARSTRLVATGDGPIKTFPLRGIKESPPCFHDVRRLTLDDTIELLDLVLQLHLTAAEKRDLLAYLYLL